MVNTKVIIITGIVILIVVIGGVIGYLEYQKQTSGDDGDITAGAEEEPKEDSLKGIQGLVRSLAVPYSVQIREVDGELTTAKAWGTRKLNQIIGNGGSSISFSSSKHEITLQAGHYLIEGVFSFYRTGYSAIRLLDVTNARVVEYGTTAYSGDNSSSTQTQSHFRLRVSPKSTTRLRFQYYVNNIGSNAAGVRAPDGSDAENVFSWVTIHKLREVAIPEH